MKKSFSLQGLLYQMQRSNSLKMDIDILSLHFQLHFTGVFKLWTMIFCLMCLSLVWKVENLCNYVETSANNLKNYFFMDGYQYCSQHGVVYDAPWLLVSLKMF